MWGLNPTLSTHKCNSKQFYPVFPVWLFSEAGRCETKRLTLQSLVVLNYSPSTPETEVRGPRVQGQPGVSKTQNRKLK